MLDPRLSKFMSGGKVIVDLGCGAGEVLDELSQLYEVVIGLDVNTTRLDQCNAPPARWSFVCADLNQHFSIETDYADVVLANQVIKHIRASCFFYPGVLSRIKSRESGGS